MDGIRSCEDWGVWGLEGRWGGRWEDDEGKETTTTTKRSIDGGLRFEASSEAEGFGAMAWDVPFEFVGQLSGTGAVAETGDIQRCASSLRHGLYIEEIKLR